MLFMWKGNHYPSSSKSFLAAEALVTLPCQGTGIGMILVLRPLDGRSR